MAARRQLACWYRSLRGLGRTDRDDHPPAASQKRNISGGLDHFPREALASDTLYDRDR